MKPAAWLGLAAGLLGVLLSVSPRVLELEQLGGLGSLFALRGPTTPPEGVTVVGISNDSAVALDASDDLDEWPRALHAGLVDRLVQRGAAVIVFDIGFEEPRGPEQDETFARALRSAGNVILFERVAGDTVESEGGGGRTRMVLESRHLPIPVLKEAALGSAPFTLPTVPVLVWQFWTFGRAAADRGSLPTLALQAYAMPWYEDFIAVLRELSTERVVAELPRTKHALQDVELDEVVQTLRGVFRRHPALGEEMSHALRARGLPAHALATLQSLVDVYAGPSSRYLSFYGSARTIRTVPYHEVLDERASANLDLEGHVVFVGYSERRQTEQRDEFDSIFSQRSGHDLSGVEIGATAYANLIEQRAVTPLSIPWHLLLVLAWGMLLGVVLMRLSVAAMLAAAAAAGSLYAAAAFALFASNGLWLPTVTPLLIQLPVALFAALLLSYARVKLQRERIRKALGYYVPARMANRLAHETLSVGASAELLHGTCLFTDAEQYTSVAESMRPGELGLFMNEYYQAMFRAVERHGGEVADLAGDSMVAIWAAADDDPHCRVRACKAALDVLGAVRDFNRARGRHELPTRVGLESGEVLLGNIGAGRRYEYRAVGDIVSTASRIQGLNRVLRTQLLVSAATLVNESGFVQREVGTFLLRGKTTPLTVHELLEVDGEDPAASGRQAQLRDRFSEALATFRTGRWADAERLFTSILDTFPADGPSRYYSNLCAEYRAQEPTDWRGVVAIALK